MVGTDSAATQPMGDPNRANPRCEPRCKPRWLVLAAGRVAARCTVPQSPRADTDERAPLLIREVVATPAAPATLLFERAGRQP